MENNNNEGIDAYDIGIGIIMTFLLTTMIYINC